MGPVHFSIIQWFNKNFKLERTQGPGSKYLCDLDIILLILFLCGDELIGWNLIYIKFSVWNWLTYSLKVSWGEMPFLPYFSPAPFLPATSLTYSLNSAQSSTYSNNGSWKAITIISNGTISIINRSCTHTVVPLASTYLLQFRHLQSS